MRSRSRVLSVMKTVCRLVFSLCVKVCRCNDCAFAFFGIAFERLVLCVDQVTKSTIYYNLVDATIPKDRHRVEQRYSR
jgi:hypothetical protein